MSKNTIEIAVAAEALAESFEAAAKDGNLSVWDLYHFADDFDEIEAAYKDSGQVLNEISGMTNEELKDAFGRLSTAFVRIGRALQKANA